MFIEQNKPRVKSKNFFNSGTMKVNNRESSKKQVGKKYLERNKEENSRILNNTKMDYITYL